MTTPISETGPWSLGTLIGLPLAVLTTITLVAVGVVLLRRSRTTNELDRAETIFFGVGSLLAATALAICTASPLGMWPYDSEYHQWRDVTGTVERAESRQVRDGDGMSERYVLVIDGHPFAVDDTRAAVADEGDVVSLRCKREWQYAAESGWACRWAGETR